MDNLLDKKKSNKKVFLFIIIGLIFIILLVLLILKFILGNNGNITINCPVNASVGEIVECTINANTANKIVLAVNAHYETTDGLIYQDFTSENGWEVYASSQNGFAIGNLNGEKGKFEIGKIKYTIPSSVGSNTEYTITLKDIEYTNVDYETISIKNTSSTIRVK